MTFLNSTVPVSVRGASLSGSVIEGFVSSTALIRVAATCARGKSTNIIITIINDIIICDASIINCIMVERSTTSLLTSAAPSQ